MIYYPESSFETHVYYSDYGVKELLWESITISYQVFQLLLKDKKPGLLTKQEKEYLVLKSASML